jgi:hypothetical protein
MEYRLEELWEQLAGRLPSLSGGVLGGVQGSLAAWTVAAHWWRRRELCVVVLPEQQELAQWQYDLSQLPTAAALESWTLQPKRLWERLRQLDACTAARNRDRCSACQWMAWRAAVHAGGVLGPAPRTPGADGCLAAAGGRHGVGTGGAAPALAATGVPPSGPGPQRGRYRLARGHCGCLPARLGAAAPHRMVGDGNRVAAQLRPRDAAQHGNVRGGGVPGCLALGAHAGNDCRLPAGALLLDSRTAGALCPSRRRTPGVCTRAAAHRADTAEPVTAGAGGPEPTPAFGWALRRAAGAGAGALGCRRL